MALVDGAAYERAMAEVRRLTEENERLHFDYTRLADRKLDGPTAADYAQAGEWVVQIRTERDAWRALADYLYDQLDNNVQAAIDVEAMNAAKARYRKARER